MSPGEVIKELCELAALAITGNDLRGASGY